MSLLANTINFNFSIFSSLEIFSLSNFEALLTVDWTKISGSIERETDEIEKKIIKNVKNFSLIIYE